MGYTTDFYGEFAVTPPLKRVHKDYLVAFSTSRRIQRNAEIAERLPDPVRIAAGLPIGFEGAYFVGTADQNMGQNNDASVVNGNRPPGSPEVDSKLFPDWYSRELELKEAALVLGIAQPGLWCQWVPDEDGTVIKWDEGEKFYDYVEWIQYLIAHFLSPWGYTLNGEVYWTGEDNDDRGVIKIENNEVKIGKAVITYNF